MSRIGKLPIVVPEKVEVKIDGAHVAVKGPNGALEYSFTEALALIKSGEIKDAKTIMLLQYAQINLANLMK